MFRILKKLTFFELSFKLMFYLVPCLLLVLFHHFIAKFNYRAPFFTKFYQIFTNFFYKFYQNTLHVIAFEYYSLRKRKKIVKKREKRRILFFLSNGNIIFWVRGIRLCKYFLEKYSKSWVTKREKKGEKGK